MGRLAIAGGSKVRERPYITHAIIEKEERQRVNEVLDSGLLSGYVAKAGDNFLGGRQVREFESLVRSYFKVKHAVAVNSATAGLHMALGACNISAGDEVIVTPYTMSATSTAIVMQNAVPVFADIDEDTFCIDPARIEEKITPRTRAIVLVHLFGYPAAMDEIMAIARKNNLYVIEDCAQAPGAKYKNRLVGTIGDIGVFSLNQHKTITSGEGGFAVTEDDKLALKMQLIRNHGEAVIGSPGFEEIDNVIGYNYRMTELEAAVSIGQFRRLDFLNDYRIELAEYLTKGLSKFDSLILPKKGKECKHVYFVYPMRFKSEVAEISRDMFVKALVAEGIPASAGYVKPLYLEPLYQRKSIYGKAGYSFVQASFEGGADYSKGICPIAERMHEKELMLTAVCRYPHTKKDMDDVVKAFDKVFKNIDELKGVRV